MPPLGQHHPLGAVGRASGAAGPRSSAPSHPTPLTPTLNLLRPTAALFHHSPTSHSQTSSTCASCRRLTPVRAIPGNSSSTTSGGFSRPSTALSAESITAEAISAEQDFLLKARKLSSRIAKLKRLQDKIARLKEEKDFLAAYMEVEASATDSDSEGEHACTSDGWQRKYSVACKRGHVTHHSGLQTPFSPLSAVLTVGSFSSACIHTRSPRACRRERCAGPGRPLPLPALVVAASRGPRRRRPRGPPQLGGHPSRAVRRAPAAAAAAAGAGGGAGGNRGRPGGGGEWRQQQR